LLKFFKLANKNVFKKKFFTKASKVSFIGSGCNQINGESCKQMGLHTVGFSVKRKKYLVDVYTLRGILACEYSQQGSLNLHV